MKARAAFAWSLRRELWENRAIYVLPIMIGALVYAAYLYNAARYANHLRTIDAIPAAQQLTVAVMPFSMAAAAILFFSWIAAIFYCLDALGSERRDRSILFLKSMPVSDSTTVLAKVAVALVLVPLWACVVALVTQALMLGTTAIVLAARGIEGANLWSRLPYVQMPLVMFYGMAAHTLWFAPILGWCLLVSGWARRAPFLWAALPFFGAFAFELIAFGTHYVLDFMKTRMIASHAFKPNALREPVTQLSQLDPERFLTSPGLWLGLLVAAVFIAAAIQYRRYREPL